jgi:hypothetical protein
VTRGNDSIAPAGASARASRRQRRAGGLRLRTFKKRSDPDLAAASPRRAGTPLAESSGALAACTRAFSDPARMLLGSPGASSSELTKAPLSSTAICAARSSGRATSSLRAGPSDGTAFSRSGRIKNAREHWGIAVPSPSPRPRAGGTRVVAGTGGGCIEVAAYYVDSELLTNAVKHASASVVRVAVEEAPGTLCLSIRDDGVGGADPARGSGLIGVQDRVESIG